ncbi:c-type cytochrome [Epibacterium ulvae]|uniref:c-type cytochrome n=1 Tax=Epibacterium ulvae TaxID=1156985 RepID=UPI0024913204|nr:cytochrome c [Epibacterium ulvae]
MLKHLSAAHAPFTRFFGYGIVFGLSLVLGSVLMAKVPYENEKIEARVALMNTQKTALSVLTDMASGRRAFNKRQARDAKNTLIETTKDIRPHFKHIEMDAHTLARPNLWTNWEDFELRAKNAQRAAKRLNPRSADTLRQSLPAMIKGCHNCHERYKLQDREFTTH